MLTLVYQVHVIECVPCIGLVANRQATVRFHFVLKKKKKKVVTPDISRNAMRGVARRRVGGDKTMEAEC